MKRFTFCAVKVLIRRGPCLLDTDGASIAMEVIALAYVVVIAGEEERLSFNVHPSLQL